MVRELGLSSSLRREEEAGGRRPSPRTTHRTGSEPAVLLPVVAVTRSQSRCENSKLKTAERNSSRVFCRVPPCAVGRRLHAADAPGPRATHATHAAHATHATHATHAAAMLLRPAPSEETRCLCSSDPLFFIFLLNDGPETREK